MYIFLSHWGKIQQESQKVVRHQTLNQIHRRHANIWSHPGHYPVHPPTQPWSHLSISWSWIDYSHPLRSISIGHPIPEIRLFQTLTLKLQGQSHRCGQRARSYSWSSILLTHFLIISHPWDTAISKFDLETSKVKVMHQVKGQGHILYPVYNWCISFLFHINWTVHSCDMAKIAFDLEKTNTKFHKEIR